uniref:Uncharacterized protein n=1 Tax=Panagrolaimus sp. ES5 TaxID=591445 RepID=A0AC34FBJ0_9BILA
MELPALGRLATFGDIYDAKTNMDIKGELKLCILSGLIELQGSAKFIKNDRSTKKFIQCSYILKTFTRKESINLNSLIDICNLNGIGGTHMVVGIQYGGNGVVTLRYTSNEMKNSSDIQGALKGRLSHIIKGELDVAGNVRSAEMINDSDLQISVIADVNFEDGDQVNTIEGATKFMEKLSGRVTKYNDGKGVKVAYDLVPLEQIFNFLGKEIIEKQIYHGLEKNKILNISRKFTKLEEAKDAAFQHFLELEDGNSYFTEAQNKFIADEKTNIEILLSTVNDEMIKAMKYFHDNDSETANELLRKIEVQISQVKIYAQKFKNETEKLLKKYDFMKAAESNEVKYISKNRALEQLKVYGKKLYICLFFEKGEKKYFNL